jgi:hypothetical protein
MFRSCSGSAGVCNTSSLRLVLFGLAASLPLAGDFPLFDITCINLLMHVEKTQVIAKYTHYFLKPPSGSLDGMQLKAGFMGD